MVVIKSYKYTIFIIVLAIYKNNIHFTHLVSKYQRGLITTKVVSSWRGLFDTTLCDKLCQ